MKKTLFRINIQSPVRILFSPLLLLSTNATASDSASDLKPQNNLSNAVLAIQNVEADMPPPLPLGDGVAR